MIEIDNTVLTLIRHGSNVNVKSHDGMTPLHCAAISGSTGVAAELVDAGADVNEHDRLGYTPLHLAALQGHSELVAQLLPLTNRMVRSRRRTVLHLAALKGDVNILQKVLEHRPDELTAVDMHGLTPLHLSAWCGHEEASLFLLDKIKETGNSLEPADMEGMIPIYYAALGGFQDLSQKMLLEINDGISVMNTSNLYLNCAAAGDCGNLIHDLTSKYLGLLEQGANKDVLHLALHRAAEHGSAIAIERLLEAGADPTAPDRAGLTSLHLAARNGHEPCIQILLKNEVHIRLKTRTKKRLFAVPATGLTPLHFAAERGHVDIARYLIERGASADETDNIGRTPLHFSAKSGDSSMAEFLLGLHPDQQITRLSAQTAMGDQPLAYAAFYRNERMAQFLLKKGAEPEHKNGNGHTALLIVSRPRALEAWALRPEHEAAIKDVFGRLKLMQCLADNGANIRTTNNEGQTAIDLVNYNPRSFFSALTKGDRVPKEQIDMLITYLEDLCYK